MVSQSHIPKMNPTWLWCIILLTHCWIPFAKACFLLLFVFCLFFFLFCFVLFCFLGLHLQHKEVPRLGAELELQLLAYTTATSDPTHVCNLHGNARSLTHQTRNLIFPSWIHFHWTTTGNLICSYFVKEFFCVCVHERYLSVVLFSCNILVWFWH